MKKIEAIIREEKLDKVRQALEDNGYFGLTVSEVSGRGRQKGIPLQWRAGEYRVEFLPKIKIEIVVAAEKVSSIVEAIQKAAWTNKIGDGKIFVLPVEQAVRIRTGEQGKEAI